MIILVMTRYLYWYFIILIIIVWLDDIPVIMASLLTNLGNDSVFVLVFYHSNYHRLA
jgi:hypothetical protein